MMVLPMMMMSDDNSCKAAVRCGEIRDQAEEDAKFGMAGRWGEFIRRRCTCRYSRSSLFQQLLKALISPTSPICELWLSLCLYLILHESTCWFWTRSAFLSLSRLHLEDDPLRAIDDPPFPSTYSLPRPISNQRNFPGPEHIPSKPSDGR